MLQWRESAIRPRFAASEKNVHAQPLREPQPSRLPERRGHGPSCNGHCWVEQGDFRVFMATRREIPSSLIEIGPPARAGLPRGARGHGPALRPGYVRPALRAPVPWNTTRHEIVGSYRLGRVDDILPQQGRRRSLHKYAVQVQAGILERLGPALELGRSFVRPEYQGQARRCRFCGGGTVKYLVRNAECKILFGPVSISQAYAGLSRRLMVEFLSGCAGAMSLRRW